MTLQKKIFSVIGAGALIVTMAGCSQAGNAGGNDTATAPTTRPTSPLNAIMDQVWGTNLSQEEMQRRLDEEHARQEEIRAQCMTGKGFEYIPNPHGGTTFTSDDGMFRPDDRDWVMQWGYGAVNSPFQARWAAEEEARQEAGIELPTDPNVALWDAMSETEMQAWSEALWGPPFDFPEDGIMTPEMTEEWNANSGCAGLARAEIDAGSGWTITQRDEFQPLMEAMNGIWVRVESDPEFAAINREWSSCMADAGHPGFDRPADAQNSIFEASNELWGNLGDDWDWSQGSPNSSNHPGFAALAEHEVELALADLDCRESVNLRDRQDAIQFAAEEQFINDHRAALDALLAAVEQR